MLHINISEDIYLYIDLDILNTDILEDIYISIYRYRYAQIEPIYPLIGIPILNRYPITDIYLLHMDIFKDIDI